MAKTKSKENVSARIRELLDGGIDKPAVIVEELFKRWKIKVTARYISTVKSNYYNASGDDGGEASLVRCLARLCKHHGTAVVRRTLRSLPDLRDELKDLEDE